MKTRLQQRQLEAFHALVVLGSASAAAEHLHITQPAVSHLMRALEQEVGFALFDRKGRKLNLTPEGLLFYEEVDRSIQTLTGLNGAAEAIRLRQMGRVRVAAVPVYADGVAAQVIGAYLAEHPEVFVEMESLNMVPAIEAVESGRFDLGIVPLPREHPLLQKHESLEGTAVCALPKGHALARGKAVKLEALSDEPFVAIGRGSPFKYEIDAALQAAKAAPRVVAEARTQRAILRMVEAGAGLSIVEQRVAEEYETGEYKTGEHKTGEYGGGGLTFRPTRPAIHWKICFLTVPDRKPSRALAALIDRMKDAFAA